MAIEYERVNWDTTMFVKPTNMNQMDAGIKAACDGVDENSSAITAINSTLTHKQDALTTVSGTATLTGTGNIIIGTDADRVLNAIVDGFVGIPFKNNGLSFIKVLEYGTMTPTTKTVDVTYRFTYM